MGPAAGRLLFPAVAKALLLRHSAVAFYAAFVRYLDPDELQFLQFAWLVARWYEPAGVGRAWRRRKNDSCIRP